MAVSKKVTGDMLRAKYVEKLIEAFSDYDPEEVMLKAKSNEIAIPTVDCNGDDAWVVLVVKVPKNEYDGYDMAQEYIMKTEEKERKAKEKEKKAKKKEEKDG